MDDNVTNNTQQRSALSDDILKTLDQFGKKSSNDCNDQLTTMTSLGRGKFPQVHATQIYTGTRRCRLPSPRTAAFSE